MTTTLRKLYNRLHLKVNEAKSAVASAYGRAFLGYELWCSGGETAKRGIAHKAKLIFKRRIRQITRRTCGRNLSEVAAPPACLAAQALAPRTDGLSRATGLGCEFGSGGPGGCQCSPLVAEQSPAAEPAHAHCVLRSSWCSATLMTSTSRTARCGPACRVVWEGTGQIVWPPLSRF